MLAWATFRGGRAAGYSARVIEALAAEGLVLRDDGAGATGPGLVFFDQPDAELYELVRARSRGGDERVVAVAARWPALDDDAASRLLRSGASDVFAWDHSTTAPRELAARFERWLAVDDLLRSNEVEGTLVGRSRVWRRLLRQVVEIGAFTNASVLLTGESGTGKELVARLIHRLDRRKSKGELVVLDCATVSPHLSYSEFYGHERGAFTGAVAAREGAFALADGGTLFLDEVGELPLGLQAELLRVVQEGTYKRVGSNTWRTTNFRLVCATNRDLGEEMAENRFRRDFYYRIAAWTLHLPRLRDRPGDVLPLVDHFLAELRPDEPPALDPPVRDMLLRREYPGNVRDLRQLVTRISHRHVGPGPITLGDVPEEEREAADESGGWREGRLEAAVRGALAQGFTLKEISQAAAETAVAVAVTDERGNLGRAARRLGVTPRALQLRRAAARREVESGPTENGG
jgi:transcriptional regulator with GAF, ATPase, and Fis domain